MNSYYTNILTQHNNSSILINTNNKKQNKVKHTVIIGFVIFIILFGLAVGFYSFSKYSEDNNLTVQEDTQKQEFKLQTVEKISFINPIDTSFTKTIVNSDQFLIIKGDQYPNLRQLTIHSNNLNHLILDGNLKLDSLVVNNSQLVTFTYNSTQLKSLLLIDNKKMTTFQSSSLPALTNLTVIRSNIKSWKNNQFANLSYVGFFESQLQTLPILNANSIQEMVVQKCNAQIPQNFFNQCPVKKYSQHTDQKTKSLQIFGSNVLQYIEIQNYVFSNALIWNCPVLKQFSLKNNKNLTSLVLKQLPESAKISINLSQLKQLQLIDLINPNLTVFQGLNIYYLYISNTSIPSLNNINFKSLTHLEVDYSKIQDHTFNISSQILTHVSLKNYNSQSQLNTESLPQLNFFTIENSIIPKIQIVSKYEISDIQIQSVTGKDSELQLKILAQSIETFKISQTNISSFSEHNVNFQKLILNNNLFLKNISHNRFSSYKVQISDSPQLSVFQNNEIDCEYLILKNNPLLSLSSPIQATYVELKNNKQFDIKQLNTLFPYVSQLTYDGFNTQSFDQIQLQQLLSLEIGCQHLVNFTNNILPQLSYLTISSNLMYFQNNTLNNLNVIDLDNGNENIDYQIFINELQELKQKGMEHLQLINLPQNAGQDNIQRIRELFPQAVIH